MMSIINIQAKIGFKFPMVSGFSRSGVRSCDGSVQNKNDIIPYILTPYLSDPAHVPVYVPHDSNEIIGAMSCIVMDDTLRWALVTQTLLYTVHFYNNAELDTAMASNVNVKPSNMFNFKESIFANTGMNVSLYC